MKDDLIVHRLKKGDKVYKGCYVFYSDEGNTEFLVRDEDVIAHRHLRSDVPEPLRYVFVKLKDSEESLLRKEEHKELLEILDAFNVEELAYITGFSTTVNDRLKEEYDVVNIVRELDMV